MCIHCLSWMDKISAWRVLPFGKLGFMQKSLISLPTLCSLGLLSLPQTLCHQCCADISKENTGSSIPLPFKSHVVVISDTRLFVLLYNKLGLFLKCNFLYTLFIIDVFSTRRHLFGYQIHYIAGK